MSGHRPFQELRDARRKIDPNSAERVGVQVQAIYQALDLAGLRKSCGKTQVELAKKLGTSQANVSRTELQQELYLTTLRSYVRALGGDLKLSAVFDDREVPLNIRPAAA